MPDFSIKIVAVAGGGAAFVADSQAAGFETGHLALVEEAPAVEDGATSAGSAGEAPAAGAGAVFVPSYQEAPQYSLITWNNTTSETHQPELSDKSFATDPILPGQSSRPDYYITAEAPAKISYCCKLHPTECGTIAVVGVVNLPPEGEE